MAGRLTYRSMGQTENLKTDAHKYAQLILPKVQKQFNGGRTALSTNGAGATGHTQGEKCTSILRSCFMQKLTQNKS